MGWDTFSRGHYIIAHPLRNKWGDTFSRGLIYYSTPTQKTSNGFLRASHASLRSAASPGMFQKLCRLGGWHSFDTLCRQHQKLAQIEHHDEPNCDPEPISEPVSDAGCAAAVWSHYRSHGAPVWSFCSWLTTNSMKLLQIVKISNSAINLLILTKKMEILNCWRLWDRESLPNIAPYIVGNLAINLLIYLKYIDFNYKLEIFVKYCR